MSTVTITNPALSELHSSSKIEKVPTVAVDKIELSEEEEERTFHNTDAAYVLPNDNIEHRRLELQHRLLWQLMGNKVFHSPVQKDTKRRTLEIGCGTGAVTHEMASTFPDAQVFGVDLSPVPQVRQKLSNISYLLALNDVDLYCGANIPSLFAEAGLTDIRITRYMVPYSRWEGLTREEKEMADYLETFVRDLIPVAIRKAGENAGPGHREEVEDAVRDAKKYHEAFDGGRNFLWMYVVCGWKPE
ncbi:methyltransferase domain-containing protein [Paraphaeosphaeria minitans]|uniref:Methyltransferase domain-containing protein n=1 Tax=Paraphaeosphaeria minitans TaxID=565426 RepID=A0A9P6G6H4_9PLEO|nr:methyltransferase domain-containing protein [Paraphaeosphaeria minitans]